MKTKITQWPFFILIFTVLSCEKDTQSTGSDNGKICYPVAWTWEEDNTLYPFPINYTFNIEGKLLKVNTECFDWDLMDLEIEYDLNGNISKISGFGDYGDGVSTLFYNSNNKLTKYYWRENLIYECEYNGNGQVSKVSQYDSGDPNNSGGWGLNMVFTYEYSNSHSNNPVKVNWENLFYPESGSYLIEYDNKKTPFSNLGNFWSAIALYEDFDHFPSILFFITNNITKITNQDEITTCDYDYNDDGFPTKVQVSQSDDDYTYSIHFEYECQ